MIAQPFGPMFEVIVEDLKRTYGGAILLMPAQAAKAFGFSEKAFYTQLSRGGIRIKAVGVGSRMRFSIYEIARYLCHAGEAEPAEPTANQGSAPAAPEERQRPRKTDRPARGRKRQAQERRPQEPQGKQKASEVEFVLNRPPLGPELTRFLRGGNG